MATLKRFFRNVLQNRISFSGMGEERIPALEIESHLTTVLYGDFTLTDAVRPSFDLKIIPKQGYKYDFVYNSSRWSMPILVVSISLEQLFETFLDMLDPLGDTVNVVLETSHRHLGNRYNNLYREQIDLPVLKSFLYDHEELILNDGCLGISVLNPAIPAEIRFDEHKLIIVYAQHLRPFETILHQHRIPEDESMPLLTDVEHVHITRDEYLQRFKTLQMLLGMGNSFTQTR